jgi:hypothetical protein
MWKRYQFFILPLKAIENFSNDLGHTKKKRVMDRL